MDTTHGNQDKRIREKPQMSRSELNKESAPPELGFFWPDMLVDIFHFLELMENALTVTKWQ